MSRPRRLIAAVASSLVAAAMLSCTHSPQGGLESELPKELLDVLPVGEKRPVEIVMTSPQNELDSLEQAQNVVISFNQPMVPLRPVSTDRTVDFVEISPKLEGRFRWKGTATLVFEPKTALPYATHYKVTVKQGVKSWSGQQLAKDYSFDFTTPTVMLHHSVPQAQSSWQGVQDPIYLHFNQPVRPQDVQAAVELRQEGKSFPVDVRAYTEEDRKTETHTAELQDAYDVPRDNGSVEGPAANAAVVTPREPLKPGTATELIVKAGLKSPAGDQVNKEEKTLNFTTRREFALDRSARSLTGVDPEDGIALSFTSPVTTARLGKAIQIKPAVELPDFDNAQDEFGSTDAWLGGDLKPNTSYQITLDNSLTDRFGSAYKGPQQFTLRTGNYRPLLMGPEGSGLLELKGPRVLPYGIRNQPDATGRYRKLTPAELIQVQKAPNSLYSSQPYTPPGGWQKTVNLGGNRRRNETEQRNLTLPGGGLYYVQVAAGSAQQRSLVAVSDIGVTAKFSPENVLIYTSSLATADPIGHAAVEVYDAKGQRRWTGETDGEGFVQAPGWAQLNIQKTDEYSAPDLWVFVRSGASQSFVHTQGYNSVSPWAFNIDYTYDQFARRFQAYAFSERGVYRPGETVQVKGSVRELSEGSFKLPNLERVNYKVTDSRDREVTKGELPVNRFGGFDQSLVLKPSAATGMYRIEYRLPSKLEKTLKWQEPLHTVTFQVEAFKPAQFEVTVNPDHPFYVMGDKANVEFKGWYLFGAPMNERPLHWSARLEPAELRPDGFEGYDFGLAWDSDQQDESKELSSGNATLDAKGLNSQNVELGRIPFKGSAYLVVEGTVTSPNRQSLSGRKAIPLHRGEFQLGLRGEGTFAQAGNPHRLELVAVRPEGSTQQGVDVKVELVRRQWNSVRKADVNGSYRWVSEVKDEPVNAQQVRTSTSPVDVDVKPDKAGFYVVRASASDSRGNTVISESTFYASGSDYVSWQRTEGDQIELVADKKSYKPGETATILIKSPFEKSRALVTLEREHIMDRRVVELTGTAPTIQVPLTSRHLPNVYVSVVLLQGRGAKQEFSPDGQDLSRPSFKIGYVNLPVAPEEKKLQIKIKTDKERYAPGDQVSADFQVLDAQGQPVEAELCVAVPDQGVLALTGYQLPDWFAHFYGSRPLAVTTCETRMDVIGQRAYGSKGANAGGGGGFDAENMRSDFRYTAYWNPSLTTGTDGTAHATFKLPDNLTTFKVMALAQSTSSQFGSSESKFEVQKPLLLQPSMPQFARKGDDFQAGVVVRNNSDADLSVQVKAQAEGLTLEGESQKSLTLGAGKEEEVLFHVKAEKLGNARLEFTASGGEYSDGLSLPVALSAPVILENVSTSGSTTESSAVEMIVPSPMAVGSGILRTFLSSSALVGLQGPLEALLHNDWAGLEPKLSKIRGQIAARRLSEALNLSAEAGQVELWLADLYNYAVNDKGFSSYSHMDHADPYLTGYALETLYRAKEDGTAVDSKLIDIARAYLKDYLNHPDQDSAYRSPAEKATSRCLALYAMSLGKFDGLSYWNNLYRIRLQLPLEGRAYLLLAGRRLGAGREELARLEQDLLNNRKVEAATVYFTEPSKKAGWTFSSNNQLTALALDALLDSPSGFSEAPKVVAWLMEARTPQGDWGDTHDNARVLETLHRYMQSHEKETPNFTATVFLLKEQILKSTFSGRKLTVESATTPISESPQRLPLGIKKDGPGRLYYELRLSYAAAKEPPARDEGLAVLKQISTVKGDRFPAELQAGETYLVTLTVVTPRDRRFVVVNDPIPAGCEVVQTQFETESAELTRILSASQSKLGDTTFLHFERYGDRVALFADGLQAGEHTFQYLIRANQPGKFSLPPTKAEEIYHPEVFGTTAGRVIEIK